MKQSILITGAMVATLCGGFFFLENTRAGAESSRVEQKVNANLYRVLVGSTWHNVPMMPLSESTCRSPSQLIQPYCN